jgi:hypothetical protein
VGNAGSLGKENKMIKKVLFLLIIFSGIFDLAKGSQAATIQVASCSYSDISNAIAMANAGDIINVPAGNCSWSNNLIITKGVSLIGAGVDKTIIIANITSPPFCGGGYDYRLGALVKYDPSNWDANCPFRLSGFTFNQNNICQGVVLGSSGKEAPFTPQTKIRVDHNKFINAKNKAPFGRI